MESQNIQDFCLKNRVGNYDFVKESLPKLAKAALNSSSVIVFDYL
jgi:hypothetical protein